MKKFLVLAVFGMVLIFSAVLLYAQEDVRPQVSQGCLLRCPIPRLSLKTTR
jgi:hypothetical protein